MRAHAHTHNIHTCIYIQRHRQIHTYICFACSSGGSPLSWNTRKRCLKESPPPLLSFFRWRVLFCVISTVPRFECTLQFKGFLAGGEIMDILKYFWEKKNVYVFWKIFSEMDDFTPPSISILSLLNSDQHGALISAPYPCGTLEPWQKF